MTGRAKPGRYRSRKPRQGTAPGVRGRAGVCPFSPPGGLRGALKLLFPPKKGSGLIAR